MIASSPPSLSILGWAISNVATAHVQVSDWNVITDLSPWEEGPRKHN